MNTWYCVNAEFYDNGEVKACMTERQAGKKPNNRYRVTHSLASYKIWFVNSDNANQLLSGIKDGSTDREGVSWLFIEMESAA